MTADDNPAKLQNALWWITSIAVSVVCCSVLFILFASYLVELKADLKDNNLRINAVEEREDRILTLLEIIRRHPAPVAGQPGMPQPGDGQTPDANAAPAVPGATTGPVPAPVVGMPPVPTQTPAASPAAPTPGATPPSPPAPVMVPAISVPAMPTTTPEKQ